MWHKRRIPLRFAFGFLAVLLIGLIALAACRVSPKTFTDGLGRTISLEGTPKRIVSLSPALTEAVFALGVGDRLVGVSTYCNRPQEAQEVEKVGDNFNLNVEKLVSLRPDLVLVAGSRDAQTQVEKELERLDIPAFVSGPATVEDVFGDIELLSKVIGAEEAAEELLSNFRLELDGLKSKMSGSAVKPKVFITFDSNLWTAGGGSFIDDVISCAGGENVAADVEQQYLQISMEDVLAKDPDVIFITIPEEEASALTGRPGWSSLRAVKEGRVYFPNADLVTRPGPSVVEGIKDISAWLWGDS